MQENCHIIFIYGELSAYLSLFMKHITLKMISKVEHLFSAAALLRQLELLLLPHVQIFQIWRHLRIQKLS